MRVRNNKNANSELLACKRYLSDKESLRKIIEQNKDKEICLEIGMGKGDFITEMGLQNKEKLFIGVELSKTVLAIAMKKMTKYEEEHAENVENVYVMSFDAKELENYFEAKEINKIYLNFSDPWPKKKQAKRRLTYETFLKEYVNVLKDDGRIEFKTDNRGLFEFSLVSMNNFGLEFEEVYLDLHKVDIPNVMTEYERKFSEKRTNI